MSDNNRLFAKFFLTLLVFMCFIYGRLIYMDPVLGFDDRALLENLMPFKKWIDIQPVRDLSYMFDLWVRELTGIKVFHLMNVLIWLGVGRLLWRLLFLEKPETEKDIVVGLLWLCFMVSPYFVYSVGWIAARKHLLSFLFTLWATVLILQNSKLEGPKKQNYFFSGILYLLGAFSNPINIAWPIWAILWGDSRLKKNLGIIAFFLLSLLLVLVSNVYYYQVLFEGHEKFIVTGIENILFPFFAYGRYIINFLFPFNLAVSYDFFNSINLFGALIILLVLLEVYKTYKRGGRLKWAGYYFLLLAPVALNRTDYFISNPYLLNASICFPLFILPVFQGIGNQKHLKTLLITIIVIFAVFSHFEARLWESSATLYAKSYEREKSYRNIRMNVIGLLKEGRKLEKIDEVLRALAINTDGEDPSLVKYYQTFSTLIFNSNKLSSDERVGFFEKMKELNPYSYFYLAKILAEQGKCQLSKGYLAQFKMIPGFRELMSDNQIISLERKCP